MTATVLLATDASVLSERVIDAAIEAAGERDAALHILCVVDRRVIDEPGLSSVEAVTIAAEDLGQTHVVAVCERAAERGVAAEGRTHHGIPHELILEYADEIDADLIVVGDHGDHAAHLGGVGRRVRDTSDREVLVVETGGPRNSKRTDS